MNHWLSADNTTSATDDNQSSFGHYTELGWEVSVGRLMVIRMIGEGKITRNDAIVTLADRTFMYSKFCNVIPYTPTFNPPRHEVGLHFFNYGDWMYEIHYDSCVPKNHIPWRWPGDIPLIKDFDFEEVNPPPCLVINHRTRNWITNRNSSPSDTQGLVSMGLEMGLKVYLSGRYAQDVDRRAEYVPRLKTLASLIHHPNCLVFHTTAGPTMLAQQCCSNNLICPMRGIDGNVFGKHPLYMSDYLNFSGCKQHLIAPGDIGAAKAILRDAINKKRGG